MATDFRTLLVAFATTGRIGPLHVGMERADLEAALRELDLDPAFDPSSTDFADKYESLDIAMADDRLVLLGLDHDGDLEFVLPPSLGPDDDQATSSFSRFVVTTLLDQAGCAWAEDPALTFADQQSAIRTGTGVSMIFARPSAFDLELPHDDELLASAYLSLGAGVGTGSEPEPEPAE